MPYWEAISFLDEYERKQLAKGPFRDKLHHHGKSFEAFKDYAQGVKSFKPLECNQLLIDRLKFIYGQIGNGASPDRSVLETLIERSFIEVPCSRYANCKGHKFDRHCKHRK